MRNLKKGTIITIKLITFIYLYFPSSMFHEVAIYGRLSETQRSSSYLWIEPSMVEETRRNSQNSKHVCATNNKPCV